MLKAEPLRFWRVALAKRDAAEEAAEEDFLRAMGGGGSSPPAVADDIAACLLPKANIWKSKWEKGNLIDAGGVVAAPPHDPPLAEPLRPGPTCAVRHRA